MVSRKFVDFGYFDKIQIEDNVARSLARSREGDAIKAAQEVIQSLRRQLAKKEELVERYRKMIAENREKEVHQNEVSWTENLV